MVSPPPENFNRMSIDQGRKKIHYLPGRSAEDFRKWAIDNPLSLCQHLKLKIIPKNSQVDLSEGFIFIYKKNRCGLHPRFGHIEIISKLSPLIACSDHCRYLNKWRCQKILGSLHFLLFRNLVCDFPIRLAFERHGIL